MAKTSKQDPSAVDDWIENPEQTQPGKKKIAPPDEVQTAPSPTVPDQSAKLQELELQIMELQETVIMLGDRLGELSHPTRGAAPVFSPENLADPFLVPILQESLRCSFTGITLSGNVDKVLEARSRTAVQIALAMLKELHAKFDAPRPAAKAS